MPELPEVQAHAERLTASFGGAELERFTPLAFTALKTVQPGPEVAYGETLREVGRRGKHLLLHFPSATFVVHLMQAGRLRVDAKQAARPRGGQARWRFADGRALLLTEAGTERRAGVWVHPGPGHEGDGPAPATGDGDGAGRADGRDSTSGALPPLDQLGPEADQLTPPELAELLAGSSMRIHTWLRDQRMLAGIGRRLANEICHRARLSPFATTTRLDGDAVERLHRAVQDCIAESLAEERARKDMSSSGDRTGAVHHRTGEPCPVCGDGVRAVEYSAYTVSYCPTCQTGGKVLADNTTSRFLK